MVGPNPPTPIPEGGSSGGYNEPYNDTMEEDKRRRLKQEDDLFINVIELWLKTQI